jgi:hypothetical protein
VASRNIESKADETNLRGMKSPQGLRSKSHQQPAQAAVRVGRYAGSYVYIWPFRAAWTQANEAIAIILTRCSIRC